MARIEVTTAIRKTPDEIHRYLADFRNHPAFLPQSHFRSVAPAATGDQPAHQMRLELSLLGRWWALDLTFREEEPGKRLVQGSSAPVAVRTTWSFTPMKADRRGPRTTVKLEVDYELPGGPLGRLVDGLLLRNEVLKVYDRVIRQLPIVLEGPPKSGLKGEEP